MVAIGREVSLFSTGDSANFGSGAFSTAGVCTTNLGRATAAGEGADSWRTGVIAAAGAGGGAEDAVVDVEPVLRFTRFCLKVFPEKKSPAEIDASRDGAGGKMSDWNESAYCGASET